MTETAKTESVPAPGSAAAIVAGCWCAVLDNGHGRGAWLDTDGKPVFWITEGCPVHDTGDRTGHGEGGV